uniref:Uncharacterized protein n=1 Tax=Trypanosoma congolense (strain IL3000) TaxID=1068625 RepID=F9WH23_TRYCI|nr:hypothetical protein, unlikely [Trypanosoma congolense IL3000]
MLLDGGVGYRGEADDKGKISGDMKAPGEHGDIASTLRFAFPSHLHKVVGGHPFDEAKKHFLPEPGVHKGALVVFKYWWTPDVGRLLHQPAGPVVLCQHPEGDVHPFEAVTPSSSPRCLCFPSSLRTIALVN